MHALAFNNDGDCDIVTAAYIGRNDHTDARVTNASTLGSANQLSGLKDTAKGNLGEFFKFKRKPLGRFSISTSLF